MSTYVELFCAVAAPNDITCDIARNSTFALAYGYDSDLEVAQTLYASLSIQMACACNRFLATGRHRRHTRDSAPVSGITARLRFQEAFAARIRRCLTDARHDAQTQALASERLAASSGRPGAQIALINKSLELTNFYRSNTSSKGAPWRGPRTRTAAPEASRAGDRAARQARLGGIPELRSARKELREPRHSQP